jgi:Fe-S cluster biogenesis protein NfuA
MILSISKEFLWRYNAMTDQANNYSRNEQISALVEQISAYIEQYHRGSVELVDIKDDTVIVHLGGACEGCPHLPATLHGWVSGTLRQFFPEIKVVADIDVEDI